MKYEESSEVQEQELRALLPEFLLEDLSICNEEKWRRNQQLNDSTSDSSNEYENASSFVRNLMEISDEIGTVNFMNSVHGRRFFMQASKTSNLTTSDVDYLYKELKYKFINIMMDTFGCQTFELLIKIFRPCHKREILNEAINNFFVVSSTKFGYTSLQILIASMMNEEEKKNLLMILENEEVIRRLAPNQSGSQLIQFLITLFPEEQRDRFNQIILNNLHKLLTNVNSFYIIKFIVMNNPSGVLKLRITEHICGKILDLSSDEIGKCVFLLIPQYWGFNCICTSMLAKSLCHNVFKLAKNRNSAITVVKFLECVDEATKFKFIKEMLLNEEISSLMYIRNGPIILKAAVFYLTLQQRKSIQTLLLRKLYINDMEEKGNNKTNLQIMNVVKIINILERGF